ncbi:hypothetical protein PIROE2DRAFT_5593, partial [Piromyces sp. E2]
MTDECLEIYNNYIGNYDNYLDSFDNEYEYLENEHFIFCMEDCDYNQEYMTLSSYMQYPYSSSSLKTHENMTKSHFECLHEYLILNEFEEKELNKTLDSILKLESIKNQRKSYVLKLIKKEEKYFSGYCKRNFNENSLRIVRPNNLKKYIENPTNVHIK